MEQQSELVRDVNRLLDKARDAWGFQSEQELAEALGVSRLSVHQWRRGRMSPSARALLPLALNGIGPDPRSRAGDRDRGSPS